MEDVYFEEVKKRYKKNCPYCEGDVLLGKERDVDKWVLECIECGVNFFYDGVDKGDKIHFNSPCDMCGEMEVVYKKDTKSIVCESCGNIYIKG